MDSTEGLWLLVVAVLWGGTNPFIRKGSQGVEKIENSKWLSRFLEELKFLLFNWKHTVPMLVNQLGTVIFMFSLSSSDLSLAEPVVNCLTLVFTMLTGKLVGETIHKWETYAGMALIIIGVSMCISAKS